MPDPTADDPPTRRPATINQARSLRRRATLTERTLWTLLRDRRLAGLKFRRQLPVGPYVLDFVCLGRRLIVEADGPFHDPAHDALRDQWLRTQGFHILRFENKAILNADPSVMAHILETATLLPLREKVSAKPTDEGKSGFRATLRPRPDNPSSDLLRRPPSPARGEGPAADAAGADFRAHGRASQRVRAAPSGF